jgi:hypothetical protein
MPPADSPIPQLWREDPTKPKPLPPLIHKDEAIVRALQSLLNKQPADAIEHLKGFDPATQEILMRLLPALAVLNEKSVEKLSPDETVALQDGIQGLLLTLRNRAELMIDKMYLCQRIDGFGRYEKLDHGHVFKTGTKRLEGDLVQVYVELRNIGSRQQNGYYVSTLNGKISLRDDRGEEQWLHNFGQSEQAPSLEPRNDCLLVYYFYVPIIAAGKYTLTLEITDRTSEPHRTTHQSVEFNVAVPLSQ